MTRLIALIEHDTKVVLAGATFWISVALVPAGVAYLFGAYPASHAAQSAQTQGDCP